MGEEDATADADADADAELRDDMRALGIDDMSEASMNELFHWAIENSDPEILKSGAAKGLSDEEIVAQRIRMKKVLRELDQKPTEGQLMKEIIDGMKERGVNVTEPEEVSAEIFSLEILQELVEPIGTSRTRDSLVELRASGNTTMNDAPVHVFAPSISNFPRACGPQTEYVSHSSHSYARHVPDTDNANDLDKMGGLDEVMERTRSRHPQIRAAAYHVIGTAASNNDTVQKQVLDKGSLRVLARQLQVEDSLDASVKALYSIGVVSRYNRDARAVLYEENVLELLLGFVAGESTTVASPDGRLRRKGLVLLMDFLSKDSEDVFQRLRSVDDLVRPLVSIVAGGRDADLDLREKAMTALLTLATLPPSFGTVDALLAHGTQAALESLRNDLLVAQKEEDGLDEYLLEIADLSREVERAVNGVAVGSDGAEL